MTLNPITVVDNVIEEYRSHLLTEFRARDPELRAELKRELDAAGFLAQEPFFQAYRPFKSGKAWRELGLDPKLAGVVEAWTKEKHAYLHQSQALEHLLMPNATPLVVTTGTGSGKTECFLLPVIQNAIEDACAFGKKSGLTAILVYPMNALANDQKERIERYLSESGHTYVQVARYDRSTRQEERERLRKNPPHILLTNYVMLEYLLVRPADRENIFADHRCRYLVLDEVHSYRGSLGANIALLIRRLAAHLKAAKQEWNTQSADTRRFPTLVQVATSATIKSINEQGRSEEQVTGLRDEAVQEFFSTLSGVEPKSIRVIGESPRDLDAPKDAQWAEEPTASLNQAPVRAAVLFKLNELLAKRPLSLTQLVRAVMDDVPERKKADPAAVREEVSAALVLGAALPDGAPNALRLRTHRFIRGGWKFHRCVDPHCGRLYPKGEQRCACEKPTAPLYICRSCGADVLRFRGNPSDPSQEPLSPNETRGNEAEWILYNRSRLDALTDDDEEFSIDKDRVMGKRPVLSGSFDPKTLLFSKQDSDYPVKCVLAPGRGTCLVCGGRAGSRDVLTAVALGTSAAVRVIAESVLEGLAEEHAKETSRADTKERLLIFADSRQDAAHQARFITYAGRYDRMRRRLVQILTDRGELSIEEAVRELMSRGVKSHDNPLTAQHDDDRYLSKIVRERASAWEEAPLLDDIAITAGYRATILNLGLVGIRYENLGTYLADKGSALADRLGITVKQLEFLARCLLDEMRRRGALSRGLLMYNPSSPDCPDAYSLFADWERKFRWPTGYAYDAKTGCCRSFMDKDELPRGITLQNFWRKPKAGGQGPGIERRFKALLARMGGIKPNDSELLESLVSLLMRGPGLIVPSKLHGERKSAELLQVNADCLHLAMVEPRELRKCSVCNASMPWVEVGTPCPACAEGTLQPPDEDSSQPNRYVQRIRSAKLIPLKAGEHTAQVTNDDRLKLEGEFKAPAKASPVNVLCCSPTLEMGIDVGGLDAVVLRNVPPRPDNYAQRGGRAGRRTRVGIVLGFARNTPHDGYFYDRPGEMISGEVPAPAIGLGNRDVAVRHLYAMVFGAAEPGLSGRMADYISLHGQIDEGRVDALIKALEDRFDSATKLALAAWDQRVREAAGLGSETTIHEALKALPARVRDVFERVSLQIQSLEVAISNWQAVGKGQYQAVNAMELKKRLLGIRDDDSDRDADDRTTGHPMRRFAEFGILPGYEFPSEPCTVRLLRDDFEDEPLSVERRFGIGQYQPDAVAHARGHRWKIVGLDLSSPWNPKSKQPDWVYAVCKNCQMRHDAQTAQCPRCGGTSAIATGVPAYAFGGFVARRDDSPVLEEEDRYSRTGVVEAYPQHDGQPVYHYDLPTGWFAELRRNETIQWLNEGKALSASQRHRNAPFLHGDQDGQTRGFYLCPQCGRCLDWPEDEAATSSSKKGAKKPSKGQEDRFGHAPSCPELGKQPTACAIVTASRATTLRIFVDLPLSWAEAQSRYHEWGYSLGYALRTGMRQLYMLDGPEVEFSLEPAWRVDQNGILRLRGALTFLDPALGGSGFLDRAARELNLVAARAIGHLDHADCESACYRCLKSYNNQRHHESLNWLHVMPDLEQLAMVAPVLTSREDYDPSPWLLAYKAGVGSPLELKFLRLFEKHGIAVDTQVPLAANDGEKPISVADFVVKGTKIAIYVDGAAFHTGDRLRRDMVVRKKLAEGTAGWRPVAFRASDLSNEDMVVEKLR